MALRIRENGRVLCAALHDEEPGDIYIPDPISYKLTTVFRVLVTEPMTCDTGRGGHGKHGEWWWKDAVPSDVTIEDW